MFYLGSRSLQNLTGVHPDLVRILKAAISISESDFGVAEKAVRTAAEQHKKFVDGVSQRDGYVKLSNHQPKGDGLGHAVDITPWVGGKWLFDDSAFDYYPIQASAVSRAAKDLGLADRLKWGAAWFWPMSEYGSSPEDMRKIEARYRLEHKGRDFIDGPHFELS